MKIVVKIGGDVIRHIECKVSPGVLVPVRIVPFPGWLRADLTFAALEGLCVDELTSLVEVEVDMVHVVAVEMRCLPPCLKVEGNSLVSHGRVWVSVCS